MVVPCRHLTGFRVQGVYSPAVIRALTRPLTELGLHHALRVWATRQEAEDIAAAWRALPLAAHADDGSLGRCRCQASGVRLCGDDVRMTVDGALVTLPRMRQVLQSRFVT